MSTPTISKVGNTGYNQVQSPKLSPEQQQLFSQVMGIGQNGIKNTVDQLSQRASGGNEQYWQQQEAPAMRQFNELQGNLASRFSGMGSGARRSSGFQNTLNTGASELAEKLQSNRQNLQSDAMKQLLSLYSNLMGTETFDTSFVPGKSKGKSFLEELLPSLLQGFGSIGGTVGGASLFKKLFG